MYNFFVGLTILIKELSQCTILKMLQDSWNNMLVLCISYPSSLYPRLKNLHQQLKYKESQNQSKWLPILWSKQQENKIAYRIQLSTELIISILYSVHILNLQIKHLIIKCCKLGHQIPLRTEPIVDRNSTLIKNRVAQWVNDIAFSVTNLYISKIIYMKQWKHIPS